MKRLCCDRDPEVCERLKSRLEASGIACLVKVESGGSLFQGRADDPVPPFPELWVLDDAQFEAALGVLNGPVGEDDPD